MSTIVQLSYNINDKLHIEDHAFPTFDANHQKELQSNAVTQATSYPVKETCNQWVTALSSCSNTFATSTVPPATTSNVFSDTSYFQGSRVVCGSAHQKSVQFHLRDSIKPVALLTTAVSSSESTETAVYDLQSRASKVDERSSSYLFPSKPVKYHLTKSSFKSFAHTATNNVKPLHKSLNEVNLFPGIVGRSCTLHLSKKSDNANSNAVGNSLFTDVPPNKKHCRSVSEPDDLFDASKVQTLWKPGLQSRIWSPIGNLLYHEGRYLRKNDCSQSANFDSLSPVADSQMTPPASPIPRPASVTVIKQEGGSYSFLDSQHMSNQYRKSSFSPLPSPCALVSPSSASHVQSRNARSWCYSSLSATKRSLSFSDDFNYTESIEYTPLCTPDCETRFGQESRCGALLRCKSHPSDLDIKRGKGRRRTKFCHYRPAVDFDKMQQNSYSRCSLKDTEMTLNVTPVFPSIFGTDEKRAQNKRSSLTSSSSPVVSDVGVHDDDFATASTAVASSSVKECDDLDVDDIENETDNEIHA